MFLASGWLRHEFARIFGEVLEVDLVASHSGITQLVVRFADSSGAYAAYKKLSGRCLYKGHWLMASKIF